jgi:tetratricopeptide (TPR) repeat protein
LDGAYTAAVRAFCWALLTALLPGASIGAEAGNPPVGQVVENLSTAAYPEQRYALYLPPGHGGDETHWPALFVLDPRGRAVPGVERFLSAAERHGYVILSSYQSRSDTKQEVNVRALDALIEEARRYRVDTRRLYLAGLSGTAHASWRFAQILGDHVAGVIAAGGGVQRSTQGPPGEATFAYYGLAGTADFNYRELLELEQHLLKRGIEHRITIFEGRHGWPPYVFTERALDWMELQAVKRGLAPRNPRLVKAELERARAAAADAVDPLERLRRRRDVVRDFQGLGADESDAKLLLEAEGDPLVAKRRSQEKKLAQRELSHVRARYAPWVAELEDPARLAPSVSASLVSLRVASLREQAANPDDLAEARSAQRILERLYTGAVFYHPRDFERIGEYERALRSLQVAVAIFPERAGGYWRLAGGYLRAGREDEAIETLRKAIGFGNVDLERFQLDPAWLPLHDRPEWPKLVAAAGG